MKNFSTMDYNCNALRNGLEGIFPKIIPEIIGLSCQEQNAFRDYELESYLLGLEAYLEWPVSNKRAAEVLLVAINFVLRGNTMNDTIWASFINGVKCGLV